MQQKRDIEQGRTTIEDMAGNNGADELAVIGAATHLLPFEVVAAARERRQWAVHVQQMMVSILQARLAEENAIANDAGDDRGSDMGDHIACDECDHGVSAEACEYMKSNDDDVDNRDVILGDTE